MFNRVKNVVTDKSSNVKRDFFIISNFVSKKLVNVKSRVVDTGKKVFTKQNFGLFVLCLIVALEPKFFLFFILYCVISSVVESLSDIEKIKTALEIR